MMFPDLLDNNTTKAVTQEHDRPLRIILSRIRGLAVYWYNESITLRLIVNLFSKALAISITPALEVPMATLEL